MATIQDEPEGTQLLFLLPIPVSLTLAIAWSAWERRRRLSRPAVTVEEYQRALAALGRNS